MAEAAQILNVGGSWLPKIAEYHYTLEDIDSEDSNRSEDGTMHRKVTRANVYHADVVHKCTTGEMVDICNAVKGDTVIEVEAFAPGKAETQFNAYVSKLDAQLIWYASPEGDTEAWWQVSYTLVEV